VQGAAASSDIVSIPSFKEDPSFGSEVPKGAQIQALILSGRKESQPLTVQMRFSRTA
jgi:hypothetical protein